MVFSSLIFIFGFFPMTLIGGFLSRNNIRLQNAFLLIASIVFYSWGEPKYILLLLITVIVNWALVLFASRNKRKVKRSIGAAVIAMDLAILFWFKYSAWFFGGVGRLSGLDISIPQIALPIGISFYTFQAISYVADVTLFGKYKAERDPVKVSLYIAFFPQLIAGPIVRYEDMRAMIRQRNMSMQEFSDGSLRFIYGFCKKILLADSMAVIVSKAFQDLSTGSLMTSFAWLGAISYMFQIYLDFSAYSDMAIGLGHMFGFTIRENFNKPYRAASIRDFWRRWHISLSIWFRDYVYIPLGGNRRGLSRTVLNMAVVWILTGIWHGANLTFIVWGVVYGSLVILEKLISIEDWLKKHKIVAGIYRIMTLFAIMLLWIVFRAESIAQAGNYISTMFNIGNLTLGMPTVYLYIAEYKWALLLCIIISFVSSSETKILQRKNVAWPVLLILFFVSVSYLVKGSFSPFLYFNF